MLVCPQRYVRRYHGCLPPVGVWAVTGADSAAAAVSWRKFLRVLSIVLGRVPCQARPAALIATPAPRRFASFISEYLRESRTPSEPARKAAATAARVLSGLDLLCVCPVGMSMSIPGHNCVFVPLSASRARFASR